MAQPGEAYVYGMGIDVIGRLVEILSAKPLDVFLRDEIFGPLKMKDSYFYLPEEKVARLVSLYTKPSRDGDLVVHENETYRNFAISGKQRYF